MPIERLDHVNIVTNQLEALIAWYTTVLGLRHGYRPESSSVGAWLYVGDTPIVHLVSRKKEPLTGSEVKLKLEHFAFSGTGRAEFEAKLQTMAIRYTINEIPSVKTVQLHFKDLDHNHIHVDFSMDE